MKRTDFFQAIFDHKQKHFKRLFNLLQPELQFWEFAATAGKGPKSQAARGLLPLRPVAQRAGVFIRACKIFIIV